MPCSRGSSWPRDQNCLSYVSCIGRQVFITSATINICKNHCNYFTHLLPGKSHGQRSLVGCSPWGREELYMTEWRPFHFSLSCIGEGNGNPLQCSCLENPRDWGAWWAAVYGVAQSQSWLKWLSSLFENNSLFLSSFPLLNTLLFFHAIIPQQVTSYTKVI